jgi:hypothetical protein
VVGGERLLGLEVRVVARLPVKVQGGATPHREQRGPCVGPRLRVLQGTDGAAEFGRRAQRHPLEQHDGRHPVRPEGAAQLQRDEAGVRQRDGNHAVEPEAVDQRQGGVHQVGRAEVAGGPFRRPGLHRTGF